MLEDRYYMRSEERSSRFSASAILMIVLTVVFALQQIDYVYTRTGFDRVFALSVDGLSRGFVWQLLTFQFLHAGLFHLAFNLLALWFFGRPVEARLGTGNFLKVYFAGGLLGGLLQTALCWIFPQYFGLAPVVGASAGICALIAAFALMEPEAMIILLVFPMKAKYLLWIETGIALFFTLVPSPSGVAHAAHLGGIIAGYAFIRWSLYDFSLSLKWHPLRNRARRRQLVKAATIKPGFWKTKGSNIPQAEQVEPEEFISREVDPILDKISAHGLQSLTSREKQILEAARAKMDKR
jgi:membrane associated rhomboid family serine protease